MFPATYITQGGAAEEVEAEPAKDLDTKSIRSERRSSPSIHEPASEIPAPIVSPVPAIPSPIPTPPLVVASAPVPVQHISPVVVPAASPPIQPVSPVPSAPSTLATAPTSAPTSGPRVFSPPNAELSLPPSPKNVASNPDTIDGPKGLLDTAADAATAVAMGAGTVLNRTLGEIQDAIEQIAKPESDDENVGIDTNARARLAAQAKLANEQRDGGVSGLVYSDESDSEDEDQQRRSFGAFGMNGAANGKPVTSNRSIAPDSTLQPAFALPLTPRADVSSKPPVEWSVEEVVAWVASKAFDEEICEKFRGTLVRSR